MHQICCKGRKSLPGALLLLLLAAAPGCGRSLLLAQTPAEGAHLLSASPRAWADAAASNQEHIINEDATLPLDYKVRRITNRNDVTREVIESREGSIGRVLARNGAPLTPDEDAAERDRLNTILQSPDAFLKRHRHEHAERGYVLELVHSLPAAMLWTYAPGQPQLPAVSGPQVVLDFTPDPHFKPPSIVTEALTGIAGRVWIDARTQCVVRVEGRILHPLDFGWGGVLARVGEGGTVQLVQLPVGRHWYYARLGEHLTLREVLVHSVTENADVTTWDPRVLPGPVSLQDAIHQLLALPSPTH